MSKCWDGNDGGNEDREICDVKSHFWWWMVLRWKFVDICGFWRISLDICSKCFSREHGRFSKVITLKRLVN